MKIKIRHENVIFNLLKMFRKMCSYDINIQYLIITSYFINQLNMHIMVFHCFIINYRFVIHLRILSIKLDLAVVPYKIYNSNH